MKKYVLLTMLLYSCSYESRSKAVQSHVSDTIVYFSDTRTNLCFAQYDRSITNVPCDAVKHMLPKENK